MNADKVNVIWEVIDLVDGEKIVTKTPYEVGLQDFLDFLDSLVEEEQQE